MRKKYLRLTVVMALATLFMAAGIYAAAVPDVIPLKDPAYEKHKKGVVQFEHKKHWDNYSKEYPEFYKTGCGECHHDDKGKPLANLKEGDDVQKCIDANEVHNSRIVMAETGRFGGSGDMVTFDPVAPHDLNAVTGIVKQDYSTLADFYGYGSGN